MKKNPICSLEQIKVLEKNWKTPFYVYDAEGIQRNCLELQDAFSWNKGYREYFAVKANPIPEIVNLMTSIGCGCDCSSLPEMVIANALEAPIMFSSNVTPAEEYRYAKEHNAVINFDDFSHLQFFLDEVGDFPETVCFRFNPGGMFEVQTADGRKIMDNPGDAKYGFTEQQIYRGVRFCKNHGVKNFGLHAFLASNTLGNEYYQKLAAILFKLAVTIKEEFNVHIAFINLSGGIGIPYRPEDKKNDVYIISGMVKEAFDSILVPNGMSDVAIYTELGRYMTGPYGELYAKVLHIKNTYKKYVGLNACAANLMRPAMYGAYHHITVLGKENEVSKYTYDITGSLCENNDKFAIDRVLPMIEVGDYVAIHDAGAHGSAMGYNYNAKLHCTELLKFPDGRVLEIVRAQTMEDYFATFCFNPLTSTKKYSEIKAGDASFKVLADENSKIVKI